MIDNDCDEMSGAQGSVEGETEKRMHFAVGSGDNASLANWHTRVYGANGVSRPVRVTAGFPVHDGGAANG